jgi:NitT/TauT family transport system ATP-binding protein
MPASRCGSEPALALRGVACAYLGRSVIEGIDLSVAPGEIVALVGPSGCGKSTLAQVAAGLIEPQKGRVLRRYRRHAMVFQEPRLPPWQTARAAIGYPLRLAGVPRRERAARVEAAAARTALAPEDLDKYPSELSGGMRQRAAVARALAVEPDMVYFDEPFTALDAALKRRLQDLVAEAAGAARFAALFITHDLTEAARLAHRVAVMAPDGRGVEGDRRLPGAPGRDEDDAAAIARAFRREDPLFRRIHDLDERRLT